MIHQPHVMQYAKRHPSMCQATPFKTPNGTFLYAKRTQYDTNMSRMHSVPRMGDGRSPTARRALRSCGTGVTQMWYGHYPDKIGRLPEPGNGNSKPCF